MAEAARRPRDDVETSVHPVPEELPMRRSLAEAVEVPVPPLALATMPTNDEVEMLVSPEPFREKVFEPMLMLPKPEPMEPEVSVPTVARLERLVMDEVAR